MNEKYYIIEVTLNDIVKSMTGSSAVRIAVQRLFDKEVDDFGILMSKRGTKRIEKNGIRPGKYRISILDK